MVNVSPFPITVTEIKDVHPDGQVVGVSIEIKDLQKDRLPKRIDARHSHLFRIGMRETIGRQVYKPRYTYVRTALGKVFTSEPRLTRWSRRAKELARLKKPDL